MEKHTRKGFIVKNCPFCVDSIHDQTSTDSEGPIVCQSYYDVKALMNLDYGFQRITDARKYALGVINYATPCSIVTAGP